MKDLVQRLRSACDCEGKTLYEAADAIEKLEAENAALQIRLNVTLDNYGNTTRERDAMRTENAQLKESRDEYSEAVERLSVHREEMLKDRVALAIENERLKAELAARWIPVSERLPKAYDEVMVWPYPSNNSMTADINTIGTWRSGEYESGFGWTENVCYPTHWMPRPAAPGAMP